MSAQVADVWSCGVMLYIMLAAAYPFGRPQDEQLKPSARMHAMLQACALLPSSNSSLTPARPACSCSDLPCMDACMHGQTHSMLLACNVPRMATRMPARTGTWQPDQEMLHTWHSASWRWNTRCRRPRW
jgi:serine/threonine protein kinase